MAKPRKPSRASDQVVTEQVNPRTTDLDRASVERILELVLEEDASVSDAVKRALPAVARAAEKLCATLEAGGRWFNLGAGTSGRMGVLDAAEIPPTFGLEPDRVQAILAGGDAALARAVEGAEDDPEAAAAELRQRGFGAADALVAISASGRTPFAIGGVEFAAGVGAPTIGITCDPGSPLAFAVDIPVAVVVGPEVVAGSTRMKGGLAQKMVLHALSTAVMVRLGRVRGNLMSELRGINSKLRERAVRVVAQLAHVPPERAARALEECGNSVARALDALEVPRRRARS